MRRIKEDEITGFDYEIWKNTVKSVVDSPNGVDFFKGVCDYNTIHQAEATLSDEIIKRNAIKRDFYLRLIRPFLTKDQLLKIEVNV